ncbi:Glutaredoxin-3 [Piscirickettsia salmonis]|uniref:Glutaredoxin n=1 Tax=Piscirickettsia salmonis TaxID=1238 RepID=A0A1L6TG33_PISSA|nr:glutaredoxin 3 [Piscirickettsia salmonis]AKP74724.1 glutaredoxin [Piscirickettsia salmonis LF-89 = ATCC VR-1361]ALB21351.1 Glutaredoxin, GrxC [Piscirickettsia salmonis]ALY01590.1 glutaredoxin [Piscirickettsia salmonis]AMA41102.1 glutaredoxin [Piscirickettsia salmonis]AOS36292.1 glutaredoxin [Piscirickettsia salmonis]
MPNVIMYTTAVCPYCVQAKRLLTEKGVLVDEIRIDLDPNKREEMMTKSNRRSVPQIFIGKTHVGGCDDLYALERDGKLDALLQDN